MTRSGMLRRNWRAIGGVVIAVALCTGCWLGAIEVVL